MEATGLYKITIFLSAQSNKYAATSTFEPNTLLVTDITKRCATFPLSKRQPYLQPVDINGVNPCYLPDLNVALTFTTR